MQRIDSALHVRGEAEFVDDFPQPEGLLHAAVFASPAACGRVRRLSCEAARLAEGVEAVLTARDIPGENQLGPIIQDEVLLAEDEVSFVGQPLVLVVAETPELARRALKRIEVDIEEDEPVTDPREAFERGQVIGAPRTFSLGDVDSAWDACEVV
ncbi:MAG: xanthine dehydrogenase, partial [Acidobacteriota bacterium]